jgi:hypothetical protein
MSVMRLLPIYEPRTAQFGRRSMRTFLWLVVILLFGNVDAVFAHGGRPHTWHDLWHTWSFEPLVVISLILTAGLFTWGREKEFAAGRRWRL